MAKSMTQQAWIEKRKQQMPHKRYDLTGGMWVEFYGYPISVVHFHNKFGLDIFFSVNSDDEIREMLDKYAMVRRPSEIQDGLLIGVSA